MEGFMQYDQKTCRQLAYCVNNIGVDFETHKCFMNEWEEKVIENF